jgi:hypothetical protein
MDIRALLEDIRQLLTQLRDADEIIRTGSNGRLDIFRPIPMLSQKLEDEDGIVD